MTSLAEVNVFLYLLHAEYQNTYSTIKGRTIYLVLTTFNGQFVGPVLVLRLELGLRSESGSGAGMKVLTKTQK